MACARAEMEEGDVEDVGLPEVRRVDGGVMRNFTLKRGNRGEDRGVVEEVLEAGDR